MYLRDFPLFHTSLPSLRPFSLPSILCLFDVSPFYSTEIFFFDSLATTGGRHQRFSKNATVAWLVFLFVCLLFCFFGYFLLFGVFFLLLRLLHGWGVVFF